MRDDGNLSCNQATRTQVSYDGVHLQVHDLESIENLSRVVIRIEVVVVVKCQWIVTVRLHESGIFFSARKSCVFSSCACKKIASTDKVACLIFERKSTIADDRLIKADFKLRT